MPRPQQVYGKRSRASHDPFAIFASSPPRPAAGKKDAGGETHVGILADQMEELRLYQKARDGRSCGRERIALGERSPNAAVFKSEVTTAKKGGKANRRKVVAKDEQDDPESGEKARVAPRNRQVQSIERNRQEDVAVRDTVEEDVVPIVDEAPGILESDLPESGRTQGEVSMFNAVPAEAFQEAPSISVFPPTPEEPDAYALHAASLLTLSSHALTSFPEWSNQLSSHFNLTKIAEASFGEVYRLSLLDHLPGFSRADESVLKVIALTPPSDKLPQSKKEKQKALKKAEAMSKPADVANEVKLLQRMSSIPGFTNFRDVRILKGRPGQRFVQAFKAYNEGQKAKKKDLSIFPDPGKKGSYADDQLWAVIEMQDAGTDLERLVESGECTSVWSVWDVFWNVVLTLAKGEEGAEFEHRDLHLGNVCVRSASGTATPDESSIDVKRKLGFSGLDTTIIDYTISRCLLHPTTAHTDAGEDNIAYHDLDLDPSIFEGDSTEEYQYDIYRYMRGAAHHQNSYWEPPTTTTTSSSSPRQPTNTTTPSRWGTYTPITNLLWLHFTLYTLLDQLAWPSATKPPSRKPRTKTKTQPHPHPAHATWKRAIDLEHTLLRLQTLLDPDTLCQGALRSAADLVGLALTEGWLDEGDVVGAQGLEEGAVESADTDADAGGEAEVGPGRQGKEVVGEWRGVEGQGEGEGEEAGPSSDPASSSCTHIQINVATMEARGLEAAEREARAASRRERRRRRADAGGT